MHLKFKTIIYIFRAFVFRRSGLGVFLYENTKDWFNYKSIRLNNMNDDNRQRPDQKPEQRKFPGGFIIFLLAGLLIFLTMQNLSNDQTAKVAFSHQMEHLVDLDLIQPSESRKIAQNDNLVTLTGKFRDRLTDDAKARYKYLDLLSTHNELTENGQKIQGDLADLQKGVLASADWFLHLSGLPMPANGYWIVSPVYNTPERDNGIVLKSLSENPMIFSNITML